MNKRLLARLLVCVMTFSMAMPVFATESDGNGSASGTTTLSGEIDYTTAYTLTIPASINNMDLSQEAETTVGDVKVTKQNDNAEFDPAKKVSVTVSYTGELVNTKNSDKKILYKLQQNKGESEVADVTTDSKLDFSASEIEAGDASYNLKAVVTETNKAGGTYSGTINFSAQVEDEKISFVIICNRGTEKESDDVEVAFEVEPGTTWGEFFESGNAPKWLFIDSEDYYQNHLSCGYDEDYDWLQEDKGTHYSEVKLDDSIRDNGIYRC